jgi:DNA polymerase III delta prime subunit
LTSKATNRIESPQLVEDIKPSTNPPTDCETFFTITSAIDTANRFYLRQRKRTDSAITTTQRVQFLEKPLDELIAESIEIGQKRSDEYMTFDDSHVIDHRQFVDKYKPTSFIDLLSDDAVNRKMLGWLKEWKSNASHPSSGTTILPFTDPASMVGQNKKVLLLGGQPGVGKSALIDVCCRHFKYQVVESNASEERGRSCMQKLISDVCGNRSVLDSTKPQILVIEEVDGDECYAADVIVDILNKHPESIKRPIICVCTDVYKKNLKSLREVSTVISLAPPKPLRLAEKLKAIMNAENIKMESLAIDKVISLCDGDIRSCLNQLQALSARLGRQSDDKPIRVTDVLKYIGNVDSSRSTDAAVKDNQKSEYDLMQMIFEPKRSRPPDYSKRISLAIASSKSLANSVSDVFAHCLITIPFSDVSMRHMKAVSELLSLGDIGIPGGCQLSMKYASNSCAAIGKPRIDIHNARKLISARFNAQSDRDSILHALIKSSIHSVRASRILMNRPQFGLGIARLLLSILNPEHNPVWVKKGQGTNYCHPEIDRISNIYAQFGILLINDELTVLENSSANIYQLSPNLRSLCYGEQEIPSYTVGSQMGETLKIQIGVHISKIQNNGKVELISKGTKRSPTVLAEDGAKRAKSINLSAWAGRPEGRQEIHSTKSSIIVKKFPFEFRFNEGHTNAVRRVLHLSDFLPNSYI